jgi:hypothetical protein
MDPDRTATTRDDRDEHRLLLLLGAAVIAVIAVVAFRPLRRAAGRILPVALGAGGLIALARLAAERLGITGEADEAIAADDAAEFDWEIPDEMDPGERPKRRSTRRR